jgi:hypothetical protein
MGDAARAYLLQPNADVEASPPLTPQDTDHE